MQTKLILTGRRIILIIGAGMIIGGLDVFEKRKTGKTLKPVQTVK